MRGPGALLLLAVLPLWAGIEPHPAMAQSSRGAARLPKEPPLPPPRPRAPEAPAPQSQKGARSQDVRAEETGCLQMLRERGVEFTAVAEKPDAGACSISEPVVFRTVKVEGGRAIALDAAVTLRCEFAGALALWIKDDLAPAVERHGMKLRGLSGVGGQECRGRNGQNGAPISEHATGNAFDLRRLLVDGGAPIELMTNPPAHTRALREEIRASACARFPTVLGSGSDAFHEDHLHIDLRERRGGYRLCQWDVR